MTGIGVIGVIKRNLRIVEVIAGIMMIVKTETTGAEGITGIEIGIEIGIETIEDMMIEGTKTVTIGHKGIGMTEMIDLGIEDTGTRGIVEMQMGEEVKVQVVQGR